MIEDDCIQDGIPLPNVTGAILARVIEYCKKHVEAKAAAEARDKDVYGTTTDDEELTKWDKDFAEVEQPVLFDLILVQGLFQFLVYVKLSSRCTEMNPKFQVSWACLTKLFVDRCSLSDENMAKILSGSPLLETLILCNCRLGVLDLTKSPRLIALKIVTDGWFLGPRQIVAPHIHCLRLRVDHYNLPCSLVDVSSLNEANLNICFWSSKTLKPDFLQVKVLEMLEKLQNVEKLTFGGNFLQILSLAELCRVPFPMFKVKALSLETHIFQYVIPGIERMLQNSPDLEKLTIHTSHYNTIKGTYRDKHLTLRGINPDQCWRSKDGILWNKSLLDLESKHIASFIQFMLKNAKALKNMVVYLEDKFEELAPTLPRNNNVSKSKRDTQQAITELILEGITTTQATYRM